jgi:hypothetical protein
MIKEIMPINPVDPEILEAHDTAKKLIRECGSCQDSLTKKIFKNMALDELDYEKELKLKSQAKYAVDMLHGLTETSVNLN